MLSKDMAATVGEYLQIWKLKLSTTKAVLVAFHLNNKKAKCELKVNHNNENLPFCSEPTILRVTFNRSFAYRRHLESLCKKLTSRVALLMRLAASGWGVGATTLRTATLVLVYSTEEYCAPVWCRSAHTGLIPLSPTTLCELLLRPIPADNLPMLAGIQPAELHRKGATPPLARHPTSQWECMASQMETPNVPAAQQLISLSDDNDRNAALWADHGWNMDRLESTTGHRTFTPYPSPQNSPANNSVGRAPVCTNGALLLLWLMSVAKKIILLTMLSCNFQSIDLPMDCTLLAWLGLTVLGDDTIDWLLNTCAEI